MFRRVPDAEGSPTFTVTVDGERTAVRRGDTVATALLLAGARATRVSPVSGAPAAPYCMMGVCFECLVTVDGIGNRQGCLIEVADGMRIETQMARREAGK